MRNFAFEGNIAPMIIPVDLAGAAGGAAVGRIDMAQYGHAEVLLIKNAGAAAEPIVVTFQQHNVASAGTPKALNVPHGAYVKGHANIEDATAFVKDPATAIVDNVYTGTSSIEKEALILIPIDAADLDNDGGYHWFDFSIADTGVGGACLGAAVVLCFDPRSTPPPNPVP